MQKVCRYSSIDQISANAWPASLEQEDPFFTPEFLGALEKQACVDSSTGWQPCHLGIENDNRLEAFLPVYLKSHSEGEFVFDWNWAGASQSAGIRYYPKLVTAMPFTPVTGPRYFSQDSNLPLLMDGLMQLAESTEASSWHLLFTNPAQTEQLKQTALSLDGRFNLLERRDCHFVWSNRGYQCFDDFLATFSSRKRKNIKKERRKVAEQGVEFRSFFSHEISPEQIRIFYPFYEYTYRVRGRQPYLSLNFFLDLHQRLATAMRLTFAYKGNQVVGAALFMVGQDTLYGRWWGGDANIDCLHFETCYYQGIDFAISQGLKHFDPGIQGEHKLLRGFEPVQTHSLHWIREPRLAKAIAEWLEHERQHINQYQQHAQAHLPYKQK